MLRRLSGALLAAGLLTAGCATDQDVRLSRQEPLPPAFVVKADPQRGLYHNVTVEEVAGTPEFTLFGGGSVVTTRPTRSQVLDVLRDDLDRTDLLAPTRVSGEYMLYVRFEDLRGPDVWTFSDKRASAKVSFRLVRWRTGEVVKTVDVAVAYQANFPGVVISDSRVTREVIAPVGRTVGLTHDPLTLYTYSDLTTAALLAQPQAMAGVSEPLPQNAELGPLNGTERRYAATRGMLSLAFDEFLDQLAKEGSLTYKRAVACSDLNPQYFAYHSTAVQLETGDAYAVDCPGAYFKVSRLRTLYPSQF